MLAVFRKKESQKSHCILILSITVLKYFIVEFESFLFFSIIDIIIIWLLQHEIETLNLPEFKWRANWLQILQQLIEDHQNPTDEKSREVISKWLQERDQLRYLITNRINRYEYDLIWFGEKYDFR